jgi:hypothetical protein
MSEQMSDALWRWSDEGELPVVVDAASCTLGLKDDLLEHLGDERKDRLKRVTIIDSIAWCKDLLPSLSIHKTIRKILVHPTCSTTHLGLSETLFEIAGALAESAEIPLGTTVVGLLATAAYCIPNWFTPPHATHSYKSRAQRKAPASFLQIGHASWVCVKLQAECMSHSFTRLKRLHARLSD